MTEAIVIDLFVEDRAHEEFLAPLLERIAEEGRASIELRIRCARGGRGQALREFATYQAIAHKMAGSGRQPAILVVGIDGNCTTFAKKKMEIVRATRPAFADRVVAACPDPHVERWYLADPDAVHEVIGYRPTVRRKKCAPDYYKRLLAEAVVRGGRPSTLGGLEFARELVEKMDLYRAGGHDRSFKAFVDEFRAKVRSAAKSLEG